MKEAYLEILKKVTIKDKDFDDTIKEINEIIIGELNFIKSNSSEFLRGVMFNNPIYYNPTIDDISLYKMIDTISIDYNNLISSYEYNKNSIATDWHELIQNDISNLKLITINYKLLAVVCEKFAKFNLAEKFNVFIELNKVGITKLQWCYI